MFDPNKPVQGSPNSSAEMRGQLTSLHDLIIAINAVNSATVDGVTTLNPGDPAQVLLSLIANTLHFTFAIPRGHDGGQGDPGPTGAQGPPFANAVVDGVTTLPAGSAATVTVSFDGTTVHFTFGIPEGGQGLQGEVGPPGEVTQAALDTAIADTVAGSSANSNAVGTLGLIANGSYSPTQMQDVVNKLDELITALRRP